MVSNLPGYRRSVHFDWETTDRRALWRARRTLVGAGLKAKEDFMRPTDSLIPEHLTHIKSNVGTFSPSSNSLTLESGETVRYDYLIVAAGLQISESRVWS